MIIMRIFVLVLMVGDFYFILFDGYKYLFNGVGEFVYLNFFKVRYGLNNFEKLMVLRGIDIY